METHKGTVFIVDDDPAVLNAIDFFLRSSGLETRTFASANAFLRGFQAQSPKCLLLDIRMPEIDGLQLLKMLKARTIDIPVIFLTGHGDVPMAVQAIKQGAFDFFQKPFDNNGLLKSILSALDTDIDSCRDREKNEKVKNRLQQLTPREKQVLEGVIAGFQTKTIAADLGLSCRTVDIYRANMMRKMQARSPVELLSLLR